MFNFSVRHIIGLAIICGSLILGVWIYYPLKEQKQITPIPGIGQVMLTWTPIMRFGEVNDIRLAFSSDDVQEGINKFLKDRDRDLDFSEEIIIGETHHLIIEARIEIPGSRILPSEEISQPFNQPDNIKFLWQISPVVRERISGEIWLYINLVSLESGIDIRYPLLIQEITMETTDLLGLKTRTAKILMVMGLGIGFILWIDLIGKIIHVLFIQKQEGKYIQKR